VRSLISSELDVGDDGDIVSVRQCGSVHRRPPLAVV